MSFPPRFKKSEQMTSWKYGRNMQSKFNS